MENSRTGPLPHSWAEADPSHTQPLYRRELHPIRVLWFQAESRRRWLMHVRLKEMKSMGLRDQVHISGEEHRGKSPKKSSPKVHKYVMVWNKVIRRPQPTSSLLLHKWLSTTVTLSASKRLNDTWEGSHLLFPMPAMGSLCSPTSQHSGKGQACGTGCQCAGNLGSLWKPSRNVSTDCLPTLCSMPPWVVGWGLDVPDRPSYKDGECSGPMKGRHSLSDGNGKI